MTELGKGKIEVNYAEISDINTNTQEGQLLLSAIAKISTESQTNKTPDEILDQLQKLREAINFDGQFDIVVKGNVGLWEGKSPNHKLHIKGGSNDKKI